MVKAIVGANWGDEGKGKITDMFAAESDVVIRFQGGANAGHTIINHYGKFALHQLPSGVFYDHTTNIIANGVALNIPALDKEIGQLLAGDVPAPKLMISDRTQIVMPYHILFDQYEEERLSSRSFGSTKSGIAPFYSDKYAKIGFQVSELFDEASLYAKVENVLTIKKRAAAPFVQQAGARRSGHHRSDDALARYRPSLCRRYDHFPTSGRGRQQAHPA